MLDNGKAPQSCAQPEGLSNNRNGCHNNNKNNGHAQNGYIRRPQHIPSDDPRFAAFMVLRANAVGAVDVSGWTKEGYLDACHDVVMSLSKRGDEFMFGNEKFDLRFIEAAHAGVTALFNGDNDRHAVHGDCYVCIIGAAYSVLNGGKPFDWLDYDYQIFTQTEWPNYEQ